MSYFNLTPRAKEDLRNIWRYTKNMWDEAQADSYVTELYQRFGWLAKQPKLGKQRIDIHDGYYCFPHRKHLVFYLCYDGHIDIIGVPHKAMDIINYFDVDDE